MSINKKNEEFILNRNKHKANQLEKGKKITNNTIAALLVAASIYGICYGVNYNTIKDYKTKVYPQVFIDNIDLSNKTQNEVNNIVIKQQNILNNTSLIVKVGENKYSIKLSDLSIRFKPTLTDELFNANKDLSVFKQAKIVKGKGTDTHFITEFKYDEESLKNFINEIYAKENVAAINPEIQLNGGTINVVEGVVGKEIDKYALYENIAKSLSELKAGEKIEVNADLKDIAFKDTSEQLKKVNRKMATYSTSLSSNSQMNHNIALATSKLNGTTLMSGETLSLVNAIGPLTIEEGYQEALGYDNDLEVGSGVCQLASTLYNSHILLGLTPQTFENHDKPLSYVPIGQDVAIHGEKADYKFKNTTAYPIYISAYISRGRLTIDLWTNDNIINGKTYKFSKEILEDGLTVRSYLEMYEGEKKVNTKHLKTSKYKQLR